MFMTDDQWSIRIEAGQAAQTRSRFAFLASTVISVALIIAIFNFEFSWLRNLAVSDQPTSTEETVQEELRKDARKGWVDSGRVKISLLGVDLAESDASILGSFGLYVLTLWFFYCMRRENHLIANLLIDADEKNDREINLAVYHGIASYTVFTTIGGDDPIRTIRPPPPREEALARIHPINVALALLFLPPFTILFTIATDVMSLFRASPFRISTVPDPLWKLLSPPEWTEVAISRFLF
jgi:hypothetical protein